MNRGWCTGVKVFGVLSLILATTYRIKAMINMPPTSK
jgi:esterase/lipase